MPTQPPKFSFRHSFSAKSDENTPLAPRQGSFHGQSAEHNGGRRVGWKWYENPFILGAVTLCVSLFVGVAFYVQYNDWPWTTALMAATTVLLGPVWDVPQQPHPSHGYTFTLVYYIYGQSLFVWTITEVIAKLISRAPEIEARERQKLFEMCELEDLDNDGHIGWGDYIRYLWRMTPYYIGWEHQKHKYYVFICLFAWIFTGIYFCVLYLDYTYSSALYFVLSTLSQMGLASAPCTGNTTMCEFDPTTAIFLSIYVIVGVPLFAYFIGLVAGIMIERSIRAEEKAILLTPLSKGEFDFACNLYGDDEELSLAEFTILELLRLQRVSIDDLEDIRELFAAIDDQTTGNLTKPMLSQVNLLKKYGSFHSNQSDPPVHSPARDKNATIPSEEEPDESLKDASDMIRRMSHAEYNDIVLPLAIEYALPGLAEGEHEDEIEVEVVEHEHDPHTAAGIWYM
jgi:Ca2+-binding EF-hand superfamily protein